MLTKEYIIEFQKVLRKQGLLKLIQLEQEKITELYFIHSEILKR